MCNLDIFLIQKSTGADLFRMKHNLNLHESIQEAISNTLYVHVDRALSGEYIFFQCACVCVWVLH